MLKDRFNIEFYLCQDTFSVRAMGTTAGGIFELRCLR